MPTRSARRGIAAGFASALLAGCSLGSSSDATPAAPPPTVEPEPDTGAVLYSIGVSTDPYGGSSPGGFGVVTGLGTAAQHVAQIDDPDLGWFGGATWIDRRRVLVGRDAPPFRRQLVFRFDGGRLRRVGAVPFPRLDTRLGWSPDGRLVASEPIEACEGQTFQECYRQPGRVFVQRADGSRRRKVWDGHFDSWAPDGRLLVTNRSFTAPHEALDVDTGRTELPLVPARVAELAGLEGKAHLGAPRWSADGRYLAAIVAGEWPKSANAVMGLAVADATGRPLRVLTSPYVISMFAWAPTGHRLVYTTSGFPDPHELFLVDEPTAPAEPLFTTGARHFDWITWSPDGRLLLLDDEHEDLWWLLPTSGRREFRALPRLGGRPLWCCPVNAYATRNG